ncbi:polysaccharide biosynthesis C-terminal domain-containing protein, partial [Vibrio sp. 10N.222.55.E8]
VLFFALVTVFKWPLIKLISHNTHLYTDIDAYLSTIKYALLLTGISQVSIALFNAMGKTKLPLLSYLLTMPVNAVVSYYLIYGLGNFAGIGISGAALGSVIALGLRMLFLLVCLRYQKASKLPFKQASDGVTRNVRLHFKETFPIAANMMVLAMGLAAYNLLYTQ